MDNLPVPVRRLERGDKAFSEEYVEKLYAACDDIRDKTYLMYHIETGLRVSDVCGTEVVHLDWDNCRAHTYDHKKDAWRYVYFPERVKSQLKQWFKYRQAVGVKDKLLFPFSKRTGDRIVKRWAKRVGHPLAHLVSSHWCRHTFIRRSRRIGRDMKAVQQNTGDTVATILGWYSDMSAEDMRREIEK